MVPSGKNNIAPVPQGRRTEMINELQKDKAALAKDIAALAAQITIKRKELNNLVAGIQSAGEDLAKAKSKVAPYLSYGDGEIAKREKRKNDLDGEYNGAKKLKEEQLLSMGNKLSALETHKASLEKSIETASRKSIEALAEEARVEARVDKLKKEIPSLEKEALYNKTLVERLVTLSKDLMRQIDELRKSEAAAMANISNIEARQKTLDAYHGQLNDKKKQLDEREEQLNVASEKALFMFKKSAERIGLPLNNGVSKS